MKFVKALALLVLCAVGVVGCAGAPRVAEVAGQYCSATSSESRERLRGLISAVLGREVPVDFCQGYQLFADGYQVGDGMAFYCKALRDGTRDDAKAVLAERLDLPETAVGGFCLGVLNASDQ